jgi:hypothetical protein
MSNGMSAEVAPSPTVTTEELDELPGVLDQALTEIEETS